MCVAYMYAQMYACRNMLSTKHIFDKNFDIILYFSYPLYYESLRK